MKSTLRVSLALAIGALALSQTSVEAATLKMTTADATRLAANMSRSEHSSQATYFVLTDRYANGSEANDAGSGTASGSFNPANWVMYHGGDFIGLEENLQRVKDMGFNAIWVTPPVVQRTEQGGSAAFHGYWGVDFTTVDPHLGTEQDFKNFVDTAHGMGIKVIMDIVVNHTADVIAYMSNDYSFKDTDSYPYMQSGKKVDITALAGKSLCTTTLKTNCFPDLKLSAFENLPYRPSGSLVKQPSWLNDVTLYHNRGDANACGWTEGECNQMGDFFGLDDVMTEDPRVVSGWATTYGSWITRFGIDGFRIDTAKHTNDKFFPQWIPKITAIAKAAGKTSFTMYGEAWYDNRYDMVAYAMTSRLQSLLDFPAQSQFANFAGGKVSGASFLSFFKYDDFYNLGGTTDGIVRNAYNLTTFLGNHDMGRGNSMIAANTADTGENLIKRVNLGNSLLFLMRGSPTVYYGDELGIKGGRDAEARQDIMPTEVEDWQTASRIGSDPIGTNSGLDSALLSNPVAAHITALQTLRANNPALVNGAFIVRQSTGKIASFSRFKAGEKTEYVVAVNGGDTDGTITVNTSSPSISFTGLLGNSDNVTASASGQLTITVPARTAVVYKADALLPALSAAPSVTVKATKNELMVTPLLTASLTSKDPVTVTFVARTSTTGKWFRLGSDDNPTYQLPLMPESWHGKKSIQVAAIVKTSNGKISSSPIITVVRSVVTPS